MEKIPQHCIDIFIKKFDEYPTYYEIPITVFNDKIKDNIDKIISKSELVWAHIIKNKISEKNNDSEINQLLMYDKSGIMLYVQAKNTIFILTTVDRMNVTEFTVNNILKTK